MLSIFLLKPSFFIIIISSLSLTSSIHSDTATEPSQCIEGSVKGLSDKCHIFEVPKSSSNREQPDLTVAPVFGRPDGKLEIEYRSHFDLAESQTQASVPSGSDDLGIAPHSIIEHSELLLKFQKIRVLGGGGQSRAYEVESTQDQKRYALILGFWEHSDPFGLREKHINHYLDRIKKNGLHNVNIAQLKTMFWLHKKNYPYTDSSGQPEGNPTIIYVFDDLEEGHFINVKYAHDPHAQSFFHPGMVMELGLGDLSSKGFEQLVSPSRKIEVDLQIKMNLASLFRDNIIIPDNKYRNYIYKPANQVQFKGKTLSDYDYWYYKLNDVDLYVPKQDYVIKRIDFDITGFAGESFELDKEKIRSEERNFLSSLASDYHLSVEELSNAFKKPDNSTATILELF